MIDMDCRGIVRQGGKQDIVHVCHCAMDFMDEPLSDLELLEIFAAHACTSGIRPTMVIDQGFCLAGFGEIVKMCTMWIDQGDRAIGDYRSSRKA
jgi:hypothetical protein